MCLKIGVTVKQIHTEHTCGICTKTPPIECCSGCGTASGIGPVDCYRFRKKDRKRGIKEKNDLI